MAKFKKDLTAMLMAPVMNDVDWFQDEISVFNIMKKFSMARTVSGFTLKLAYMFETQSL